MRALWALAFALGATPLAGQTRIDRTVPFHPSGDFRIMVLEGSLRVRSWTRDSVRVTGTLDAAARDAFYFGASPSGAGKMGVDGDGRADLEVSVPTGTRVWIKTVGASIDVAGVDGAMDLYSVTGPIRVEASPRALYAESMGGDIALVGDPPVARLKTGAGSLDIRGGGSDLTLASVNGDIAVAAADPIRRVRVETVGGAVTVEGALSRGSSLVVNSHDGPVELGLPRTADADFLVATLEGELRNRLTSGVARKAAGLKGRELSFTSGRGGAEVTVRTFSGTVTIRPLDLPE